MSTTTLVRFAVLAALAAGCTSASTHRVLVARTPDPGAVRQAFLEATLRVLDEHPAYVDQLFLMSLSHPRTLARFLDNSAQNLHDPALASLTARLLVRYPPSLRAVLVHTLEAARDEPAARLAIAEAIAERSTLASAIIADRPETVHRMVVVLARELRRRPPARRAFLAAMRDSSGDLARLLRSDRRTFAAVTRARARAGAQEATAPLRGGSQAPAATTRGGGPR